MKQPAEKAKELVNELNLGKENAIKCVTLLIQEAMFGFLNSDEPTIERQVNRRNYWTEVLLEIEKL
jgi:hypothetical protein